MLKLDIGCGRSVADGFVGVDITPGPCVDHVLDISDSFTVRAAFENDSVSAMRMSHVLEHFTGRQALKIMETLWHIAAPGCKMDIRVPYGQSNNHWRDPDHVRAYLWDGFNCFTSPYWGSFNTGNTHAFGYTADWLIKRVEFRVEPHEMPNLERLGPEKWWFERGLVLWNCIVELRGIMEAVKPARAQDESLSVDFDMQIHGPEYLD